MDRMAKKLPPEALEFFRKQGSKGGKVGSKRLWASLSEEERTARAKSAAQKMTPEARVARAKKAALAAKKKRKAAKKKRPNP